MQEAVRARLVAELAVPVAWGTMPPATALPYVVCYRLTGGPVYSHDGATGAVQEDMQVDAHGRTYAEAVALIRDAETAVSGWRSGDIEFIRVLSRRDAAPEAADMVFRASFTARVAFQE